MTGHNINLIIDAISTELSGIIYMYIKDNYGNYETVKNVMENLEKDTFLKEEIIKPIIELYFNE